MSDFNSMSLSPRRVRQVNAIAALRAIFACKRLSRAELARQLGLNRSSSGSIVGELTTNGLVREVAEDAPRPLRAGRPGILLELVPDAAFFVGAEIGVEHISALRIGLDAGVVERRVVPFEGRSAAIGEAVGRAVDLAFAGMSADELQCCEGFGLAVPAQMDRQGKVRVAPLLGWRNVDLTEIARSSLPATMPAIVENDANAFAIGDAYAQHGRPNGVTLFLVMESGVGGGLVIGGELFRGGHGLAGEIGHIHTADADGAELEEVIGLDRLLTRYRVVSGQEDVSLELFLADVRDRAPNAVQVAEEWSRHLAFALVQACRLVDPDRIVLGGSLAELYPMVAARVGCHIEALQAESFPQPEIDVHEAPETGAAYGAACMLHQRFLSLENEMFAANPIAPNRGDRA
jgi:predicted NBD/HSP70 family sugar kinase